MMRKSAWMVLGALACLTGCAKDRNIEDYRSEKFREAQQAMALVQGDYRGAFVSSDGRSAIGGMTVHVTPDRIPVPSSGAPVAEQEAVLKITVSLTGQSTKTLTFGNGSFDLASQQFKAVASVSGRGSAQLLGTFAGDTLTGTLEADGFPERGGAFTLKRGGPMPSFAGVRTRAEAEDLFLFNTFSAIGTFRKKSPNPEDDRIFMMIRRQATLQEQDLMDVLTPYRYVDVAVFFNELEEDGSHRQVGGTFKNAIWDVRSGSLTGTYASAGGQGLLDTDLRLECQQTQAGGWSCDVIALTNANGLVFSANFAPAAGGAQ